MKKGYIYIENGKVVWNAEERPKEYMFTTSKFGGVVWNTEEYIEALKAWQDGCVVVENANISQHPMEGFDEITILKPVYQIVSFGQVAFIKGKTIVKLG